MSTTGTATIIIFGAGVLRGGRPSPTLRARVEAAFRCGGPGAHYIPTGAIGRHGPSEASVMAGLLTGFGVPPDHITLEETATNTMSSARACAVLLAGQPGAVRFASSFYHLPRCRMLLWFAGVRATACLPPPRGAHTWYWCLREAVALPVDAIISVAAVILRAAPRSRANGAAAARTPRSARRKSPPR